MHRLAFLFIALALITSPIWAQDIEADAITVTTDASGDADVTTRTIKVNARIVYIWYQGGFDATADFTITCQRTTEGLWTESNIADAAQIVAPTKAVQDQVGGDRAQYDYIWCPQSTIRIVIAQGGNAKSGIFEIAHF